MITYIFEQSLDAEPTRKRPTLKLVYLNFLTDDKFCGNMGNIPCWIEMLITGQKCFSRAKALPA